jgi:pyruvate dehydrogenase E2 component (dihydrolipoamide acetyltransferase)
MATEVIMPALGMAQEKGTLVSWFKTEGESVTKGEPLMEVETDKATVEIEAPASGILANVTAAPGDEVPVGQTIALILAAGESPAKDAKELPTSEPARAVSLEPSPKAGKESESRARGTTTRLAASPAARKIAKEKGINLASLKGTGPEGSIVAEDVLRAAQEESPSPGGPPKVKETVPLSTMRRIVGRRMAQSKQSAPHFYVTMDSDMTAVERKRTEWKAKGEEIVPSINDFILWASARALRDFPSLNAAYTEAGIQIFADINIGVAVAIEEGLVVPVIRNADRLTLQQLAQQSRALAEKAQRKKLFPLDYEGGTFTVSNLGMLGVDNFVAIINPPQCAILAVGRIAPRVVADQGEMVIRSTMTMTLSADHRVVDGVIAARFLQNVKASLEKA